MCVCVHCNALARAHTHADTFTLAHTCQQVEEELIHSVFLNDAWLLDVGERASNEEVCRWRRVLVHDNANLDQASLAGHGKKARAGMPCPRMNVHAAAGEDGLWIFGGKCDGGDREATFDDVWWMQWCEGRQGLRSVLVQGMSVEADVWFDSDDDQEDAEGDGEAGEEEGQEGEESDEEREAGLERGGAEGVGEGVDGGVTAEEEVQEREEGGGEGGTGAASEMEGEDVREDIVGEACDDALGNGWSAVGVSVEQELSFERRGHLCLPALVRRAALEPPYSCICLCLCICLCTHTHTHTHTHTYPPTYIHTHTHT